MTVAQTKACAISGRQPHFLVTRSEMAGADGSPAGHSRAVNWRPDIQASSREPRSKVARSSGSGRRLREDKRMASWDLWICVSQYQLYLLSRHLAATDNRDKAFSGRRSKSPYLPLASPGRIRAPGRPGRRVRRSFPRCRDITLLQSLRVEPVLQRGDRSVVFQWTAVPGPPGLR